MHPAALAAAVIALATSASPPRAVGPHLVARTVAPDTYVVTVDQPFPGNTLVARMATGDVVIVGAPYTTAATDDLIAFVRRELSPTGLVAIDGHFHMDGAGGNAAFLAAGARVVGSDLTARLLEERGARRRELGFKYIPDDAAHADLRRDLRATAFAPPGEVFPLRDGVTLRFGDELVEVRWPGPSHAPDLVVVTLPSRRLVFGGCMFVDGPRPVNLSDADVVGWRRAVDDVERHAEDVDLFVPGHGDRLDRGLLASTRAALSAVTLDRRVAVTVDDLPWAGPPPARGTAATALARLATTLAARRVPATGFVVGGRGGLAAVRAWTKAGLGLADHTLGHKAYSKLTPAELRHEVEENGRVVKDALGVDLRGTFFRLPFLDHGHTDEKVAALQSLLDERKERLAPVSLDTIDYLFATAYGAHEDKDGVARLFVEHVDEVAEDFEALSRELYGREVPLVLLVHANALQADHIGDVLDLLVARGYRFVPLGEALDDAAYAAYGNRPPFVPPAGDRNFLNQVARSRGVVAADPSGERRYETQWAPRLSTLR